MNLAANLSTLDPAHARDQSSIWMTGQLYNGLVTLDEHMKIAPSLAHSWEITDSGRIYTFHLENYVYFHPMEGEWAEKERKLTSSDFIYSFTRILDPVTASSGAWIFSGKVVGASEFRAGEAEIVEGFQAPDDSTLIIKLIEPFPPMLGLLSMPYASAIPAEAVEKYGAAFRNHPVGTGPFRFKSWEEGVSLTLLKNEAYFEEEGGSQLPYLDAIRVRFIRSKLSEFVEFCQGNLDFINGLDDSFKDEVLLPGGQIHPDFKEKYQFDIAPQLNTEFLGILVDTTNENVNSHPLGDIRVRKALNLAIDRQKLVDFVLNGNGRPAIHGIIPPGAQGFDAEKVTGYRYDPREARELLREAGFPGGKGMPVITLNSNANYQKVMEFVQKSWERLGISCEIDNTDGATLRELASKGEINLWRASWIADYPDGENYLSLFYSGNIPPNGPNRMRYADTVFDSLYNKAISITDDSSRFEIYHQMENRILDDAPVIPLYYDRIIRIIQPGISNLTTNPMNLLILKSTRKKVEE